MRHGLALLLFLFSFNASAVPSDDIIEVLQAQQSAWNRGDIDAYMQGYWQSDKLRFVSGGQLRYGWSDIAGRYKKSYPTTTVMGQLHFDIKDIKFLSNYAALVVGRWTLTRDKDTPSGVFSLLFERIDDQWVITHDHTSD